MTSSKTNNQRDYAVFSTLVHRTLRLQEDECRRVTSQINRLLAQDCVSPQGNHTSKRLKVFGGKHASSHGPVGIPAIINQMMPRAAAQ